MFLSFVLEHGNIIWNQFKPFRSCFYALSHGCTAALRLGLTFLHYWVNSTDNSAVCPVYHEVLHSWCEQTYSSVTVIVLSSPVGWVTEWPQIISSWNRSIFIGIKGTRYTSPEFSVRLLHYSLLCEFPWPP